MDEDSDEVYYINVVCSWLNSDICLCKDYLNWFNLGEECLKLICDKIDEFNWLFDMCVYCLMLEG